MEKLTILVIYIVKTKNAMNNLWFFCCNLEDLKFDSALQRLHD